MGIIPLTVLLALSTHEYSRADYKHWIDADKDCQSTRQEVLIAESLETAILDDRGCKVISGKWYDFYTDRIYTNPNDLDVDHFIPLAEVDRSGGSEWPRQKKMEYANDIDDPHVLIAVSKGANRSKGDKDPSDWMPTNKAFGCDYVRIWQEIKKEWKLEMDEKESEFINNKNLECVYE